MWSIPTPCAQPYKGQPTTVGTSCPTLNEWCVGSLTSQIELINMEGICKCIVLIQRRLESLTIHNIVDKKFHGNNTIKHWKGITCQLYFLCHYKTTSYTECTEPQMLGRERHSILNRKFIITLFLYWLTLSYTVFIKDQAPRQLTDHFCSLKIVHYIMNNHPLNRSKYWTTTGSTLLSL